MQLRIVSKRLLGAAVMLLLPLQAAAQSDDDILDVEIREYDAEALFDDGPAEPDWIPSLRIGLGVYSQSIDGEISNPALVNSSGVQHLPGIRRINGRSLVETTGGNPIDGPWITAGLEMMGPPISEVVRPFFLFEYRDSLEGSSTVIREQSRPPPPSELRSRVRIKGNFAQKDWFLAGLGLAIQLPIEGRNVKLKPSINWFYTRGKQLTELIQPVTLDPNTGDPQFKVQDSTSVSNHGIAPRIELDAELYREGPFSVGFFIALDFMVILSGDRQSIVDAESCFGDAFLTGNPPMRCRNLSDPTNPRFGESGTARFDLKRDRVTYGGAAGIRLSWMGGP